MNRPWCPSGPWLGALNSLGRRPNTHCPSCGRPVERGRCADCLRDVARFRRNTTRRHRTLREKTLEAQSGTRRCTKCRSFKPLSEFYRRSSGLNSNCRSCLSFRARQRNVRLADDPKVREQRRAQKRRWHERQRLKRVGPQTRADDCTHFVYRLGATPSCLVCGRFLKQTVRGTDRPG